MLGWTQNDLAREAHVSKTSIVQFETGLTDSRSETLRLIGKAFLRYGIEFLPPSGVNRHQSICHVFNDDQLLTTDWPLFLQGLVNAGHRRLALFNWPEFAVEFQAHTGFDATIVAHDDQPYDRAAMFGLWLIMPILGSTYRIALFQPFESDLTSRYL